MLTLVDRLANGIRLRHQRSVETALRDGANPNAQVVLSREERFGAAQAPVIFLAIHYDMPHAVRTLVEYGAEVHRPVDTGLTPRAHAAWRLRWQCVDSFDDTGMAMQDDGIVLSVIANHWSETAMVATNLEEVFFHRLDHASSHFAMTPELAICFVVGTLCGWEGYRVPQLRRLLAHAHFKDIGQQMHPALQAWPERFAPHYVRMHRQAKKLAGDHPLPDPALEVIAEHDIPLAPAVEGSVNAEAMAWLQQQQARLDALQCQKKLEQDTPQATQAGTRGRL